MQAYTIHNFNSDFPTDSTCLEHLKNARWPKGIHCENCKRVTPHHRIKKRPCYSCDYCANHVYPLANTIFHKSPTPLRSWFHAIFLMASTRCGISAKQLQRELGVTYKCAWRIFGKVRELMDENVGLLSGKVEMDDTYIGGKRRGKRGRGAAGKTIALGIVERKGRIKVKVTPDLRIKTIRPQIKASIKKKSTVYTDDLNSYGNLAAMGYKQLIIEHGAKKYVRGDVHTNTIEGFWSLVKRGIDGVHHVVSPKYLQNYLDSYAFRYNHRDDETPMFSSLLRQIPAKVARPFSKDA